MTESDRTALANPTLGSPDPLRASLSDADDRLLVNHWMPVCTENFIRIEPVKESPHGGGDDRAHPPCPESGGRALQVEEPA